MNIEHKAILPYGYTTSRGLEELDDVGINELIKKALNKLQQKMEDSLSGECHIIEFKSKAMVLITAKRKSYNWTLSIMVSEDYCEKVIDNIKP